MEQINNWWCWASLFMASVLEAAWVFSLREMKVGKLRLLTWQNFYLPHIGLNILWPFAGYAIFGACNVFFFSFATKQIPMAIAFAAWTGISLAIIKIAEVTLFKEKISFVEVFFMMLIMAGVFGLKIYGPSVEG